MAVEEFGYNPDDVTRDQNQVTSEGQEPGQGEVMPEASAELQEQPQNTALIQQMAGTQKPSLNDLIGNVQPQ